MVAPEGTEKSLLYTLSLSHQHVFITRLNRRNKRRLLASSIIIYGSRVLGILGPVRFLSVKAVKPYLAGAGGKHEPKLIMWLWANLTQNSCLA